MTTPALTHLDNTFDVIRSTDVITRIAELERQKDAAESEGEPFDDADASELHDLVDLELQCLARRPRMWSKGITLYLRTDAWTGSLDDLVDFAGVTYVLRVG